MLTINVIGKNCNVKIDGTLYTVVVNEKFDLKKLQNLGLKYYYNLNESKNYFDELGEHITSDKRASYKATADAYKNRISKMVLEAIEAKTNEKVKQRIEKKLEEKKLRAEKREYLQKENAKFYIFKQLKDFTVRNGKVYLKGLNFELPQDFLDVISKEYNNNHLNLDEVIKPYINFMYNLSSNPNEDVRNKIFSWVHSKGFKITENGYIYAVRWVVKKNDISELTQFVHSEYTKKKIQKKSPKNYYVYERLGDYKIVILDKLPTEGNVYWNKIGNLYELFHSKEDLEFTDNYTNTFTIKLGEVVSMNRKDCDETSRNCSSGLHALSLKYAENNSFGDQLIGIIVDPKNIVALPYDSYEKFRCCEYYVHNLLSKDDIDILQNSDLVIDDTDFEMINIGKLFEDLVDKTDLYKTSDNKQRLKEIKEKLQSYKVKPDEPEQLAVINRTIKL